MPSWLPKAIGYGVVAVVVALIPQFVHGFRIVEFTYVGVYTVALVGLVILTGITGQISLGQGAFMALGAYTTAILSVDHGWPQLLTIPAAGLVAGVAGFLFGFPALRLSGVYLALATFSLAVIIPSVAIAFSGFTGGTGGILLALPTSPVGGAQRGRVALLRDAGRCVAILYVLAFLFVAGKRGRALRAIRENELAATASGREPLALQDDRVRRLGRSTPVSPARCSRSCSSPSRRAVSRSRSRSSCSPDSSSAAPARCSARSSARSSSSTSRATPRDVLGPVVNFAQKIGLPVDDVDKTTPGVPSVVYGVILLLVLFLLPNGAAGTRPPYCIPNEASLIVV